MDIKNINELTKSEEFVDMQNKVINENITYRKQWEEDNKNVVRSYQGNKYPTQKVSRSTGVATGPVSRKKDKQTFVNIIKRQYRVMANYLLNNEPQFTATKTEKKSTEGDLQATRELINYVLDGRQPGQDDESFYDTTMDDTIFYWLFRGIVRTMVYYDPEIKEYVINTYDPYDTYVNTDARGPRNNDIILRTYTKSKNYLKTTYKTDIDGVEIKWDEVNVDKKSTMSDTKNSMLIDKPNSSNLIIREWMYLQENDQGVKKLHRVITTQTKGLSHDVFPLNFMPVTYYTPTHDPEELYPRSWYADLVTMEREINELMIKINNIIKTWWRFCYIKKGTILKKGSSQLMNELGIEVIEVSDNQELPQQTTLLSISQSDLQRLEILMKQADYEWGMQSDIMGQSSLWADASGRAIQALQAGSKNNMGMALTELNKYINRLIRIILKIHDVYWDENMTIFSEEADDDVQISKESIKRSKIKVTIVWADAFDEITKEVKAMNILDYVFKFNPDTKISPEIITAILGTSNDYAKQIQEDIDKQQDPDMQIAEWENKKMMEWIQLNANLGDNHELHMAMHGELLKNIDPQSPAGEVIINHLRMHEAMMVAMPGRWAPPTPIK